MSYPKQIVSFRPTRGINVDLPASEISDEEYTQAHNMHFRDGFADRTIGEVARYAGVETNLRNLINLTSDSGTNFWVYSGEDEIHAVAALTHSDITPVAGLTASAIPDEFTTSLLNGLLIWNNGIDPPQFWDSVPANPMVELPGWIAGDRCAALRPFKNHIFALGMTESVGGSLPMKLKWSSAAPAGSVPTSWTPLITNEAGDTQLADTRGAIIDALPLRGSFIIYKEHSTYLCDFIGGQFVFNFRKLFVTSGLLSRNCVVEHSGHHYALTDDDIIRHDGHTIQSLLDKRARRAIFGSLNQDAFQSSFAVNYEQEQEIWFCIPTKGSSFANLAVIYNLVSDAWSQRDLVQVAHGAVGHITDALADQTWDADSQAWNLDLTKWNSQESSTPHEDMLMASTDEVTPTDSRLVEIATGSDFDGEPITAVLEKRDMSLGDADRLKMVRRVWPKVEANVGVSVDIRIGSAMQLGDPIQWSAKVPFVQGTTSHIDTFAQGRYISFEASSFDGLPWQLNGFDMEVEMRGYF